MPPPAQQGQAKPTEPLLQATPWEGPRSNHHRKHLRQYKCSQATQKLSQVQIDDWDEEAKEEEAEAEEKELARF
jgi:hypothetical protein